MAIPTGNKPTNEQKDKGPNPEFEKRVQEVIKEAKQAIDIVQKEVKGTEQLKTRTMWNIGNMLLTLGISEMKSGERRELIKRFVAETGMSESSYYLAVQIVKAFDEERFNKAVEKGLTVTVAKALVSIKDPKLREKLLNKAVEERLDDKSIRELTGARKARADAGAGRQKAANKPPLRVFCKGRDHVMMTGEIMSHCTDAVARLSECNEDDRQHAMKVLLELRESMEKLMADAQSFLKFTESFAKATKPAARKE